MAYFDSPKNQVMWKIELAALKKERAEREKGNFVPKESAVKEHQADHAGRRRITFAELEAKEAAASGRSKNRADKLTKSKEIRTPVKEHSLER